MKKYFAIIIGLVMIVCFSACGGNSEEQDAVIDYVNQMSEISYLENDFLESYESVTGTNYTDDETTYLELTDNTLPIVQELNEKALDIECANSEILNVHNQYLKCLSKRVNALGTMITALEYQDPDDLRTANDYLEEANDQYVEYQTQLEALMEKYNVVYDEEE